MRIPFITRQKPDARSVQSIATTETRSLSAPTFDDFMTFGAVPTIAGASVTPQTAMRSPAVRAAVEAISEAVGGLPLFIYQRDDDARERAPDHPAYGLLHDDANEWTPATSFREQITRDALLWGNGYAFINRGQGGVPRELLRLAPHAVSVKLDCTTSEPTYRLKDGPRQWVLDRRDVLHIAAPSIDGVSGASPVIQAREAIATNLAIEKHVGKLFAANGRIAGFLKLAIKLDPAATARQKASWQKMEAEGGTAVLDPGTDYQQLGMSPADMQALELWQHSVLEICRAFRVPPHLVFELGRATWGNASEMGATFLRFTLDRWLKAWQGEIRLKLIDPEDRATFYAEFLTDDLLRADFATRATAYGQYRSMGVMTANEVRAGLNLPPLPGGDILQNPYTTTTTEPAGGKANG